MEKKCTKCGVIKPVDSFYKNKNTKDGLLGKCKECSSKDVKKWKENNKKHISEYNHQYRELNKEKISSYNKQYYHNNINYHKSRWKEWREKNKEHIREYYRRYYKLNKEHKNEYRREYGRSHPEKVRMYGYQWRDAVHYKYKSTCQCCHSRKDIVAHHIYSYHANFELREQVINGITLCKNCHIEFHQTYGYKNNNLAQLTEFMEDKGKGIKIKEMQLAIF